MSPSDASLPSSSRRRYVSPTQVVEVPESPDVPKSLEAPVPPQAPEGTRAVEATQIFGGGPLELSLPPLYLDHTSRHIWDGEVILVGFVLFKICIYSYYKFLVMIYFSAVP